MKSKYILFILGSMLATIGYSDNQISVNTSNLTNYLKKPTGQYSVGYEDHHWVNQKACPDFNFNGKNQDNFSSVNTKHCHEIVARIYYPSKTQDQPSTPYYTPFVQSEQQNMLKQFPTISKIDLEQLTKIKSFSLEKAAIIKNKQFPVLLFSPGFSGPTEVYENLSKAIIYQRMIVTRVSLLQ